LEVKSPLYDERIERAVIGNLMVDQTVQDTIIPRLRPDYFFDSTCYVLASAIIEMYKDKKKIDMLTVRRHVKVDDMDLLKIQTDGATAINIHENVAIIQQLYVQRYAGRVAAKLNSLSEENGLDVEEISKVIDEAYKEIDMVFSGARRVYSFEESLNESVEAAKKRFELFQKGELPGIHTGFIGLDGYLFGWQKSDLVIIAARPSMGKTSICLHHARSAARKGKHVRIYSLEMSRIRLVDRMILSECGFKANRFASGDMMDENLKEIQQAADKLKNMNIWIDDKSARSIESIHSDARRWNREGQCDIVIIDYLQLSEASDEHARITLNERASRISRRAKAMAKDLDIPVLLLSQLNRETERRSGLKIPQLSDLRDSGSIEQDADVVLFVYRPSVYGDDECERAKTAYNIDDCENLGFYIISKNRNGSCGYMMFQHNESLTKMWDSETTQTKELEEKEPF